MQQTLLQNKIRFWPLVSSFFVLFIFLFTFDKLPFLNYSAYSPSAIFPMFIGFIVIALQGLSFGREEKIFISFIFFSVLHSVLSGAYYNNLAVTAKHSVTLLIGFMLFTFVKYAYIHKKDNLFFEKVIGYSLFLPVGLGFLQLFNQLGLNLPLVDRITGIFVENVYVDRVQMTSSEPSWAVMHLLSLGMLVYFTYKKTGKFKKLFFSMVILFFMSFSVLAYGMIFFSFLLYLFVAKRKGRFKILFIIVFIAVSFSVLAPVILDKFNVSGYYVHRFNLSTLLSPEILKTDVSAFVRVVFPLIGVLEFLFFPLGRGGGFYYTGFSDLINKYFPYGLSFKEVIYNTTINPENANPRNLIVKIMSEEGILGIVLFGMLLLFVFKKCRSNYSKFVYCVAISLLLNFDSYAFLDFWLLMGILSSGYFDNFETKQNERTISTSR